MKRSQHFSRQYRQFRFLAKTVNRHIESGRFETFSASKKQELLGRLRHMYLRLRGVIAGKKLRRALAGAALILGLGQGVQAQNFAAPLENPFGLSTTAQIFFPQSGDIDNDGDIDIIGIGNSFSPSFYFDENIGDENAPDFAAEAINPFGLIPVPNITVMCLGDIDNDGDLDILVGDYNYAALHFYENIGTPEAPNFAAATTDPFGLPQFNGFSTPQLGDIDNDGDLDLFVGQEAYYYYPSIVFFENVGTPEVPDFAAPVDNAFGMANSNFAMIPQLVDIDNDCDLDFVFSDNDYYYDGSIAFQENEGTPTEPAFAAVVINPFGLDSEDQIGFSSFADFDGDADVDLVYAFSYYYSTFLYFENISDPVAAADNTVVTGENSMYAFAEADFNFDGSGGESLATVMITELAALGDLSLNGMPVAAFDEIAAADISNLVFTPNADEFGSPYTSFLFKVSDTAGEYSGLLYTMQIDVAEVSGVNSVLLDGNFQLSPNPASDLLVFEAELTGTPEIASLELYNVLGQQLEVIQLDNHQLIRQEVQIEQLAAGSYSLVLRTDAGSRAFRFIKK